jgi:hypothetical protein
MWMPGRPDVAGQDRSAVDGDEVAMGTNDQPPVDVLVEAMETPAALTELALLEEQMDVLAAELVLSDPAAPTDVQIQAVEDGLEDLLAEPLLGGWSTPDAL